MPLKPKPGSGFTVIEFAFIFGALLIMIVLNILRFDQANRKSAVAQAKRNLKTICELQKSYFETNGRYGELADLNFKYPGPTHSFEYFISLAEENTYFLATAKEKDGCDPLNNNQPGDQIMTIDPNGYLGL
jgi:hypothetical protein